MPHKKRKYYVVGAAHGPRIEETKLYYGYVEAENTKQLVHDELNNGPYFGHVRIEVFNTEEDYRNRRVPLTVWDNIPLLSIIVGNPSARSRFEQFFVSPLPVSIDDKVK